MEKTKEPNSFVKALRTSSGKSSFIVTLVFMAVLFIFTYFVPQGKFTTPVLMVSGVLSVVGCQHFGRIIQHIRMEEDERAEQ